MYYRVAIPKGKLVDTGIWVGAPDEILVDAVNAKQPFWLMIDGKEFKSRQTMEGRFQLVVYTSRLTEDKWQINKDRAVYIKDSEKIKLRVDDEATVESLELRIDLRSRNQSPKDKQEEERFYKLVSLVNVGEWVDSGMVITSDMVSGAIPSIKVEPELPFVERVDGLFEVMIGEIVYRPEPKDRGVTAYLDQSMVGKTVRAKLISSPPGGIKLVVRFIGIE
jgi:hypothetical protein